MKNNRIGIGIIGCGWIAEKAHISSFLKIDDVYIAAVCDNDVQTINKFKEKFQVKNYYNNPEHLINDDNVNAIVISTPNSTHYTLSEKALLAGKHVLCEKPIAFSSAEVDNLIRILKKTNTIFLPAFVNRFRNDVQCVKDILDKNLIGEIISINAQWIRRAGVPRPGSWFTQKDKAGGGVLMDLGPHIIDIILMYIKFEKLNSAQLYCKYDYDKYPQLNANWYSDNSRDVIFPDVESSVIAELNLNNDLIAKIEVSWLSDIKNDMTFFIINGENGSIEMKTLFGFSTNRLWSVDEVLVKNSTGEIIKKVEFDITRNESIHAFERMAHFFISSIRGNKISALNYIDAYNTTLLIEELYKHQKK